MKTRQYVQIEREVQVTVTICGYVNPDGSIDDLCIEETASEIKGQIELDPLGYYLINEYNEMAEV